MSLKLGIAAVWGSQSTTKQEVFHYENNRGYKKTGRAWTDHPSYRAEKKPEPDVKDALEITVQDDCIILKKAANTDIFTGGTEDLVEYEGKKVSKASILALAKLAGLKLAE